MSVNLSGISSYSPVSNVKTNYSNNIAFRANEVEADTFEKQNANPERTLEEKQAMVKKARQQGAGWSAPFGIFATLYFALRSDKKVAEKFDLDPEKDKDLVKKIKQEQTLWSISGIFCLGLPALLLATILDSSKIVIDKTI